VEAEKQRLNVELQKTQNAIESIQKRLANTEFTTKAPQTVVEQTRNNLSQLQEKAVKLRESITQLG
jgi:valyl-tRNA synthetase